MNDILGTVIIAGAYLVLFALGELVYHVFKSSAEVSRKLVHFGSGMVGLFLPVFISNHWIILALCIGFTLVLYASMKWEFLKSINAVDRNSAGSILFPVVLYLCFLEYSIEKNLLYYYSPILVLAICDPLAALIGKKWPVWPFKIGKSYKSLSGSFAFFLAACVTMFLLLLKLAALSVSEICFVTFAVALVSTLIEAISINGFDNVTVPLSVLLLLIILLP